METETVHAGKAPEPSPTGPIMSSHAMKPWAALGKVKHVLNVSCVLKQSIKFSEWWIFCPYYFFLFIQKTYKCIRWSAWEIQNKTDNCSLTTVFCSLRVGTQNESQTRFLVLDSWHCCNMWIRFLNYNRKRSSSHAYRMACTYFMKWGET